jgi:hypothetical protein
MDCGPCRLKAKCCPKSSQRRIPRSIYEGARDVARSLAGTEAFERSRHDRKRVEMLFAHLKRILKLGRLRLRGPHGAQDEFTLGAIAQNLRRLTNLWPDRRPLPPRACPCRCLTAPLHGHQDHCSQRRPRGNGIPAALKAPIFATKSAIKRPFLGFDRRGACAPQSPARNAPCDGASSSGYGCASNKLRRWTSHVRSCS